MNKSKIVFLSVAVAAGIGLSSCAGPGPAGDSGQVAAAPSPAAADPTEASSSAAAASSPAPVAASTVPPSASATPSSPPAAKPAPAQAPAATPGPEDPAGLASFTFPDGHLSFSYPENWTIRLEASAPAADRPPGADAVAAVLADGTGNDLLAITSHAYGGDASGPVLRTVLDNAPVPGLRDTSGEQLDFGFAFDSLADHPQFHMGIRKSRDFEPAPESSGSTRVALPHGDLDTRVFFDTPAFPSIDAAKAWMATKQYGELKQVLLSIRYQ